MTYTKRGRGSISGECWNFVFSTASRQDLGLTQEFYNKQTHKFIPYEYVTEVDSLHQYCAGRGAIFDITDVSTINSVVVGPSGDCLSDSF